MRSQTPDPSAGVPAGRRRLGSWHSYRYLSPFAALVVWLALPWSQVPDAGWDTFVRLNVVAGLLWAVPCWRPGVLADHRGVRFTGVLGTRWFRWEQIDSACIARIGIEPRFRLDLVDGTEWFAPGFRIPYAQADSRKDGWRSTEMFRATVLITAEAERRRRSVLPRDGAVVPRARLPWLPDAGPLPSPT